MLSAMINGIYPEAMLAYPRTHLGADVINEYDGYAQAGVGAPEPISVNPRFRARYQRGLKAQSGVGSYVGMNQAQYQTFQHESPFHPGAPGWTQAPVPGWGMNPNLALPVRKATEGIGAYYANHYTAPIGIGSGEETGGGFWADKEKAALKLAVGALAVLLLMRAFR